MSIKVVDKEYLSKQFKEYHNIVNPRLKNVEETVSVLNADVDTEGSVKHLVTTEIAKVVDNAPETFDTLKEIFEWTEEHGTDVLEMNTAIKSNADALELLNGDATKEGSIDYKIAEAIEDIDIETETENIDFTVLLQEPDPEPTPDPEPDPEPEPEEPAEQIIEIVGEGEVNVGETIQLTSNAPNTSWTSGDNNIATVDETGLVTGVAEGEVTIIASAEGYTDGSKAILVKVVNQ